MVDAEDFGVAEDKFDEKTATVKKMYDNGVYNRRTIVEKIIYESENKREAVVMAHFYGFIEGLSYTEEE